MSQAFRVKRHAPHRTPSRTPAADRVACIEIANRNLRKQRTELRQKVDANERTEKILRKDLDAVLKLLSDKRAEAERSSSSLGVLLVIVLPLGVGVFCTGLLLAFA